MKNGSGFDWVHAKRGVSAINKALLKYGSMGGNHQQMGMGNGYGPILMIFRLSQK